IRTENINDYNFKCGDILAIKEQDVATPTTTLSTSKLILDENGIYGFDNKKVAANLLNEDESDLTKESDMVEQDASFSLGTEIKKKKVDLEIYLLILVLIIAFIEIYYVKQRGDL
ncbi:MAG: hypothetical protein ABIJ08_03970, partial [Nanoarchaeota archaeon]